jgi:hypothetical protein
MDASTEPFENANEADVVEQELPAEGGGPVVDPPTVSPGEATAADAAEQGTTLSDD